MKLRMVSWLVIEGNLCTILILFDYRTDNRSRAIFIVVYPGLLRNFVPLTLLDPVKLNLFLIQSFNCQLVFVLVTSESLTFHKLLKWSEWTKISNILIVISIY